MNNIPIKVRRYSGDSFTDTDLIRSDKINNELLIETLCHFNDSSFLDTSELMNSDIEEKVELNKLLTLIRSNLVYQGDFIHENGNKSKKDYYAYQDGIKTISIIVEAGVNKLELVFEDNTTYEIALDQEFTDCYRLVIISYKGSDVSNVVTETHKLSDRPHLNYYNDIMTDSEMIKITNRYIYNSLTDIRNNNLLGFKLSESIW